MTTVGTWNVENLFRPGGDGPSSRGDYDAKLETLAATIKGLAPDVLAVQEVGDPAALDDLVQRLDGEWYADLAAPDSRGIRVGILSVRPLATVEQVTDYPRYLNPVQVDDSGTTIAHLGRAALSARVDIDGVALTIVSAHLKSKLLSFPGGRFAPHDEDERARFAVYALHRRAAEAAGVRTYLTQLLDREGEHAAVILAGDMNDEPSAATTQILQGPPGSEIGTAGYPRPDTGDAQRLWNLAPLIPEAERYSRIYRGRRELIDHLFVSHRLLDTVDTVRTGPHETPSITDNPLERRDALGSDHRPVVATLDL